ncbi:hypothetical protein D3C71_1752750 [compost metagenome]
MSAFDGGETDQHLRAEDKKSDRKKAHRQQGVVVNRRQPQCGDRNHQTQREEQNHRRTLPAEQQIRAPSGEQRAEQTADLKQHHRRVGAEQIDAVALR